MVSMRARVGSHQSSQIQILFPVLTRDLKSLSKTNLAANILPCKKKKKSQFDSHKAQNFSIWIRLSSKGLYISLKSGPRSFSLHRMAYKPKVITSWNGLKSPKLPTTWNELKARKSIP